MEFRGFPCTLLLPFSYLIRRISVRTQGPGSGESTPLDLRKILIALTAVSSIPELIVSFEYNLTSKFIGRLAHRLYFTFTFPEEAIW